MPKPNQDESKDAYLHRFMGSPEAMKDYPEEQQRFAVAMSLWEHRNMLHNALGYNAERGGAEPFAGRHLQTGLVRYDEITHPITGQKGVTLLLTKDALDAGRDSIRGVPLVNWEHKQVDPDYIKNGKADGLVMGGRWNGDDAWEHIDFFAWDQETKANCRNGFRLSCAYNPTEIDWTPGKQANLPYDGVIKNLKYTHVAVLTNPRYAGAVIYANSQGGVKNMIMKLLGLGKDPVTLNNDHPVEMDGKKRTVGELVNALAAADAEAAKVTAQNAGELKDEDTIEIDGKKRTVLEAKNALRALEAKPKVEPEVKPAIAPALTDEELQNKIDAGVKAGLGKALEDLKGDVFFNGIAKLAQQRPNPAEAPAHRRTERDRVAEGRARYGKKAAK